jgi:hypothetical protein
LSFFSFARVGSVSAEKISGPTPRKTLR